MAQDVSSAEAEKPCSELTGMRPSSDLVTLTPRLALDEQCQT